MRDDVGGGVGGGQEESGFGWREGGGRVWEKERGQEVEIGGECAWRRRRVSAAEEGEELKEGSSRGD